MVYQYRHIRFALKIFTFVGLFQLMQTVTWVSAQLNQVRFNHLTIDQGLSGNAILSLAQDSQGFMWIGTSGGLNRYDGYSVKVFPYVATDTTSISSNRVRCILIDKDDVLWAGTDEGLNRYDPVKGRFIRYSSVNVSDVFKSNYISSLVEDGDGNLWIGTKNGLLKKERNTNRFVRFSANPDDPNGLMSGAINRLCVDSYGYIWIATDVGLSRFEPLTGKFKSYRFSKPKSSVFSGVNSLFIDTQNRLWLALSSGGVKIVNLVTGSITGFSEAKLESYFNELTINSIIEDGEGNIWFGTVGNGVHIYETATGQVYAHRHRQYVASTISWDVITTMYKDRSGSLWLGTYGKGLNIYHPSLCKFEVYKNEPGNNESLSIQSVVSIFEDIEGAVWVCGFGGSKLDIAYSDNNKFTRLGTQIMDVGNFKVIKGDANDPDIIWLGTTEATHQLLKFHRTKRLVLERYSFSKLVNIKEVNVYSIADDGDFLWIGTTNGLIKFNKKSKSLGVYGQNGIPVGDVQSSHFPVVFFDSAGVLWVGNGLGGLFQFDIQKEIFKMISHKPDDSNSLSNNTVYAINEDALGQVWIGTGYGLNKFNRETKTFTRYFRNKGLYNELFISIATDDSNRVWTGVNEGLAVLDPVSGAFHTYGVSDGLQSNDFNQEAVFKGNNGFLYFGGAEGYNRLNARIIPVNNYSPPIVLTDFKVFNQSVTPTTILPSDRKPILTTSIENTNEIVLMQRHSVFSFEFAALNFINPEKNQYAYQMEGVDKDWNYVENRRFTTYTKLKPGEYFFKVRASNNDGLWNNDGLTVKIIVKPPLYRMLWFQVLITCIVVILIFLFYYLRVNSLKKQKLALEARVGERTRELVNLNDQLEDKNEEIVLQKELLEEQNREISDKNIELQFHRENLENIVSLRTLELEKAIAKAVESDNLKTSFLANMSHEIRTPMNAIVGFSTLLGIEGYSEEERQVFVSQVRMNSEALLTLINDIIDLSKIQSGQIEIRKHYFELNDVMIDLKKSFEREPYLLAFKNIDFEFVQQSSDPFMVMCDPQRLTQILVNIIGNAFKYTEEGYIHFGYRIVDDRKNIEFYVKDSGIGIPPDKLELIFRRFLKIEDDKTKVYRGAGLGLAISRNLVELLGGKIWAESIPGEGSTFFFTIPYYVYPQGNSTGEMTDQNLLPENVHMNWSKHTIIIAEDEMANFLFLRAALKPTQIKIIHAHNGQEAVDLFKQNQELVSLVIMDVKMPEKDGVVAFREIRELKDSVPIIALTAFALNNEKVEISKIGFNEYLTKPVKVSCLLSTLQKFLEQQM